jgi:hypothetical protein
MKKTLLSLAIMAAAALCVPLAAGQAVPAPVPQPVEIRVHVAAGGNFVDDLSLADFGLVEDGRPQPLRSLTLIRSGQILRRQGIDVMVTPPPRSYTLLFQLTDWDPNVSKAVEFLFGSVLRTGDHMTLVTPFKPYHLQSDALSLRTKAELAKAMEETLRKDILRGSGEYRDLVSELSRLSRSISGTAGTAGSREDIESDPTDDADSGFGLETQIDRYRQSLMRMEGIRLVDEAKLLSFAASLKPVPGQKTVILFYQREFRPEINPAAMNRLMSLYQDNPQILANLMDLFQLFKRERKFDADAVKKAFADAGIDFHFIFMEKKSQRVFGATMHEQSEDVYPGFVEIAQATGGTSASSTNPAAALKAAAAVSTDYYLLTYLPGSAPGPGFRRVDIQVKRPGCQVLSPAGFFMN